MNSAAVNLRVHVSLQIKSFLWMYAQEWDCRIIYRLALILLKEMKQFQKTKTQTSERALPLKNFFKYWCFEYVSIGPVVLDSKGMKGM